MKKYILYTLLSLFFFLGKETTQAQPFYGYQTIGVHTFYFSLTWDGKPHLGGGYIFRDFGTTFTDFNAEWRFPIDQMYKLDNHQVIVGMYKPLRARRTFVAIGVHAKIQKQTFDSKKVTHYGLGLSVVPSYVYAAPLDDGLYGTTGIVLAYEPVLFSQIKEEGKTETKTLTGHRVRVGGHLDFHLQRTVGISTNGFFTKNFTKETDIFSEDEQDWKMNGSLYMGSTYYLKRAF